VAFKALISGVKRIVLWKTLYTPLNRRLVESKVGHDKPYISGRSKCFTPWASPFSLRKIYQRGLPCEIVLLKRIITLEKIRRDRSRNARAIMKYAPLY
jgi:hypothetical protein